MEWVTAKLRQARGHAGYVALVAVAGFFIIGAMVQEKTIWGQVAAAWIQAIGSIFAILAGFELARQARAGDRRREEDRETERKAGARRLAIVLCEIAVDRMKSVLDGLEMHSKDDQPAGWMLARRSVEADVEVMALFNLHDLEARDPMQTFALVGGLLRSVIDCIDPLARGGYPLGQRLSLAADAKNNVGQLHLTTSGLLAKLRHGLGPAGASERA